MPGIGVKGAHSIMRARRSTTLGERELRKLGIAYKRARFFITCNGSYAGQGTDFSREGLRAHLAATPKGGNHGRRADKAIPGQLSLFESVETPEKARIAQGAGTDRRTTGRGPAGAWGRAARRTTSTTARRAGGRVGGRRRRIRLAACPRAPRGSVRMSGDMAAAGSTPITLEEPLADVAYAYDGTLEGLLSAVFEAYERREDPQDVTAQAALQPRLGQTVRFVETDVERAVRVQRGIKRVCGHAAYDAVMRASLSDEPDAGTVVYRFVRYAMAAKRPHDCTGCRRRGSCSGPMASSRPTDSLGCSGKARGSVLNDLAHPAVEPLHRLVRSVGNERHHMVQFLRFEHLENGVWLARCNPKASVVPLLMDWFAGRFNTQPFIIYDEVHRLAGVYEGHDWYLVRTDELDVPDRAAEEGLMQAAWKRFYRTVAVEARYNPELRRQFMPKRLWKNILEMHEDLPGTELARAAAAQAERLWRG
ncbi:MAG: TIGR03915 family putative DNA repair protein [Gordonibacter pamelaeae]